MTLPAPLQRRGETGPSLEGEGRLDVNGFMRCFFCQHDRIEKGIKVYCYKKSPLVFGREGILFLKFLFFGWFGIINVFCHFIKTELVAFGFIVLKEFI